MLKCAATALLSILLTSVNGVADVTATLDPSTVRSIGGISEFNRDQFITIHETSYAPDMSDEVLAYLENELEVSYGRDGGAQSWQLKQTPADPNNPDWPDVEAMAKAGAEVVAQQKDNPRYPPHLTREVVLCTHPQFMMGIPTNNYAEFGPRSPEAAAEFRAQYLKHFWTDENRPRYYEVFNEPFVHADEIGVSIEHICEEHLISARRIRELVPDIMIGGYTAAWAEVEARNFQHWENWQKKFMDIAGAEMDFFSTHLYDGINIKGTEAERTGSNTEAIIDLIDTYSHLSYGVAKPQVISEYGRIIQRDPNKKYPYSPRRDALLLRSFNGMLMTYMDHPDRLIKTVPFILGIGSWTYEMKNFSEEEPYSFLLFRKVGDHYVTTELELFYRFWKGVRGQWRLSDSTDPDIRCHLIADGPRLNVALCNLDTEARTVSLKGLVGLNIVKAAVRRLQTHEDIPTLTQRTLPSLPEQITLEVGESALLLLDLYEAVAPIHTVLETRYYATDYLHDIEAEKPIRFTFEEVVTGKGTAKLRLSIGREPAKSLKPEVRINGHTLEVPTDWAGGTQSGRPMFYGMIEVPVPMEYLDANPTFELTFPDTGGKVACAVLQVNRQTE